MAQNQPNQNTNANTGYLIKNEKKNDRQPDYRGKITIDGKEWNLAVWAKGQRDGKDFFSLSASDPATAPAPKGSQNQQHGQQGGQSSQPSSHQQHGQSGGSQNQSYPSQSNQSNSQTEHPVDDEFGSVFDGLP